MTNLVTISSGSTAYDNTLYQRIDVLLFAFCVDPIPLSNTFVQLLSELWRICAPQAINSLAINARYALAVHSLISLTVSPPTKGIITVPSTAPYALSFLLPKTSGRQTSLGVDVWVSK